MTSLFNQTDRPGPNILVIKDDHKYIFGGYFSSPWKVSISPYGSGECFVFTFRDSDRMKVYYSTLANSSYMSSDHEAIIIGSGGAAAIYIDCNLEAGTSSMSKTYNNQKLSGDEHFQIIDIEIWGLV